MRGNCFLEFLIAPSQSRADSRLFGGKWLICFVLVTFQIGLKSVSFSRTKMFLVFIPLWRATNFCCKGPNTEYLVWNRDSSREFCIPKWRHVVSQLSFILDPAIWILYDFHVSWNRILLLTFLFQPLNSVKDTLTSEAVRFGPKFADPCPAPVPSLRLVSSVLRGVLSCSVMSSSLQPLGI